MQDRTGSFIVIDGADGSGKSTQFDLLRQHLEQAGYDVATVKFPRYDEPSSYFIREYLQGSYGKADEVGPYTASLFYALDRYQASFSIREQLAAGKVVLCDRFTGSNMAHQGAKFSHPEQRRGYFIWLDNLEFELLGIPRPSITLVLNTPFEVARERLLKKDRSSTHIAKDIHEIDMEHIKQSLGVYLDLCQLFPKDFTRIDTVRSGELLSVDAIGSLIWEKIAPLLPTINPHPKAAEAAIELPAVQTGNAAGTPVGEQAAPGEAAGHVMTSGRGNVYAFTHVLSPAAVNAAAIRCLSSNQNLRTYLRNKIEEAAARDAQLLPELADSKQLTAGEYTDGLYVLFERASALLVPKLMTGNHWASYRWPLSAGSTQRYYTPPELNPALQGYYAKCMDMLFGRYDDLAEKLTKHLELTTSVRARQEQQSPREQALSYAMAALPMAAAISIGLYASGPVFSDLILNLQSDELPEAQAAGKELLLEARQVMPQLAHMFSEAAVERRVAAHRAVQTAAKQDLSSNHASQSTPVQLVQSWPRNELDLLATVLYDYSDQPQHTIQKEINGWPYERKAELLKMLADRVLPEARYTWDVMCDQVAAARLRAAIGGRWSSQPPTPRHGYEMPEAVEEAGLADEFERSFELSLELYSRLQEAGHGLAAQYAVLHGHRARWSIICSAQELRHAAALTNPIAKAMQEKATEVHPLIADIMKTAEGA